MTPPGALLLYDGTCGFCARTVQFVLRHEGPRKTLRFASLQGATGSALLTQHHELDGIDSIVWAEPSVEGSGHVLVRSQAILAVAAYLGGGWRVLGAAARLVPRAVRDAVYDFIARHRHEISGPASSCLLPTPEQRSRFLDP